MSEKRDRSATRIEDDYPAGLYPHRGDYRPPEYVAYMERAAAALKTVRIIAYSGMVAFVILAAYGFFLIYQLTTDAHRMTQHMAFMSGTMGSMRDSMGNMEQSMQNIEPMRQHMANMDASTQHMASTVSLIQHSARNLDRSFGPMMGNFNRFMPFMGGGERGYQGSPPMAPPTPLTLPFPGASAGPQRPPAPVYGPQPWAAPRLAMRPQAARPIGAPAPQPAQRGASPPAAPTAAPKSTATKAP